MDLNQYNGSMNAKDCIYQNPKHNCGKNGCKSHKNCEKSGKNRIKLVFLFHFVTFLVILRPKWPPFPHICKLGAKSEQKVTKMAINHQNMSKYCQNSAQMCDLCVIYVQIDPHSPIFGIEVWKVSNNRTFWWYLGIFWDNLMVLRPKWPHLPHICGRAPKNT